MALSKVQLLYNTGNPGIREWPARRLLECWGKPVRTVLSIPLNEIMHHLRWPQKPVNHVLLAAVCHINCLDGFYSLTAVHLWTMYATLRLVYTNFLTSKVGSKFPLRWSNIAHTHTHAHLHILHITYTHWFLNTCPFGKILLCCYVSLCTVCLLNLCYI